MMLRKIAISRGRLAQEVQVDRLPNVLQGLFARVAFADATGQRRHVRGKAAFIAWIENDL